MADNIEKKVRDQSSAVAVALMVPPTETEEAEAAE